MHKKVYPEAGIARLYCILQGEPPFLEPNDSGWFSTNMYLSESQAYQVPVENVEELVRLLPVIWFQGFADALLERRLIVVGRPLDERPA